MDSTAYYQQYRQAEDALDKTPFWKFKDRRRLQTEGQFAYTHWIVALNWEAWNRNNADALHIATERMKSCPDAYT